jgi:hypothetical protein
MVEDAHARPVLAGRQRAMIRHEAVSGDVSFWRRRRAATSPSTLALTPAVPATGQEQTRARPKAELTLGSEIQGWFHFCFVDLVTG